jgi:hypothetical protein
VRSRASVFKRGLEAPAYGSRKPRQTVIDPFTRYLRERVKITSLGAPIAPHSGDLGQGLATLVGSMPSHQPVFDLLQPSLQLRIFLGMDDEELASQRPQCVIRFEPLQQRLGPHQTLGGHQAELRLIAPDGMASWVRWRISWSRRPTNIRAACCSQVLTGTKRVVGSWTRTALPHQRHRFCRA